MIDRNSSTLKICRRTGPNKNAIHFVKEEERPTRGHQMATGLLFTAQEWRMDQTLESS